jgi:tetratricopeptide (TPR) repeat protein
MEGYMKGLVKPVSGLDNVYKYYMRHSPDSGVPTKRIETYLLPKGAELISTTPESIKVSEENGRIKLSVDEIIPAGGSLITSFQYKLTNDQAKSALDGSALEYAKNLRNKITVSVAKSPDGDRLTFQYAAIELCKAANVPYQWDKSQKQGGEAVRRYIEPVHFENTTADAALKSLLAPVGLTYQLDEEGVFLCKPGYVGTAKMVDALKAEDLTSKGWLLWKERKLADAEVMFKKAIEVDPRAEGAYQGLGWAQLNQGKRLKAEESFKKCVELNPKNSAALNGLGWIAKGEGKTDEAIGWWEKAVAAQPGATAALGGLAETYLEQKQYEKASIYYKKILQFEPNNKQAQIGLEKVNNKGKVKSDTGRIQELIKELDNPNAKIGRAHV